MNITDIDAQKTYTLGPGDSYTCARGERHIAEVVEGKSVKAVSIFNPPLEGFEKHDAAGSYPPPGLGLRYSGQPALPWFVGGYFFGVVCTLIAMHLLGRLKWVAQVVKRE